MKVNFWIRITSHFTLKINFVNIFHVTLVRNRNFTFALFAMVDSIFNRQHHKKSNSVKICFARGKKIIEVISP